MIEDVSLNTAYRFSRVSKLDLSGLLSSYVLFLSRSAPVIVAYYSGTSARFPTQQLATLEVLYKRADLFLSSIRQSSGRYLGQEHLSLRFFLEEIRSTLAMLRQYNRFIGSSITSVPFSPTIRKDIILSQGQTLESADRDVLGSADARNSWVSLAVDNRIKEEDYTLTGGYKLSADFTREARRSFTNTQIFDVIDTPVKLLGIDIDKRMTYDERIIVNVDRTEDRYIDFKLLTYDETFIQSIDTLSGLRRGANPYYPEDGYDIGSLGGGVSFTTFYNQLALSFASDESIRRFLIKSIENQRITIRARIEVESIFGIAEAREIDINPSLEAERFELPIRKEPGTPNVLLDFGNLTFPTELQVGEQMYLPAVNRDGRRLRYDFPDTVSATPDAVLTESNLLIPLEVPAAGDLNVAGDLNLQVTVLEDAKNEEYRVPTLQSITINKANPSLDINISYNGTVISLHGYTNSFLPITYTATYFDGSAVPDGFIQGDSVNGYYFDFEDAQAGVSFIKVRADVAVDSNYEAANEEIIVNKNELAPQGLVRDLIPISTLEQLDAVRYDLNGDGTPTGTAAEIAVYNATFVGVTIDPFITYRGYQLVENLDFAGTKWENPTDGTFTGTHEAGGWLPIGSGVSNLFTAVFEGNDKTISNLYISRNVDVGLFGYLGSAEIRNLGVVEGAVTAGTSFLRSAGILVGRNSGGTISACYATGTAEATGSNGFAGGLVGWNTAGTISDCYATGNVTSIRWAGGLVGDNRDTITDSYATGNVEATGSATNVGGLVGNNAAGTITTCYATGMITATGINARTGGLVGNNTTNSPITTCYATGMVTATGTNGNAGGLVGNIDGSTITNCYATGSVAVTGAATSVGGLVAMSSSNSTITNSYFDTDTSGIATGVGAQTTMALQAPISNTGIYAQWSITVWDFGTSTQYPFLR